MRIGPFTCVVTRQLVRTILEKAQEYAWTIQGFGMLRLHLSDAVRLNIWHQKFRVPRVSMMHTHPWNFDSMIISGGLTNIRYVPNPSGEQFSFATIRPGPGGGVMENGKAPVRLYSMRPETYLTGDVYTQWHDEIHISLPDDGTITLNHRQRVGEDTAEVFWPLGTEWVSAEPRHATAEEIQTFVDKALEIF